MNFYSKSHKEFLKTLTHHNVKFLLIGGHAAIFYGVMRNTGDLDILIEPTSENGRKIIQALESLKLEIPPLLAEEFSKEIVLSFGLEPDAVDILNFTPGVEFNAAYRNARTTRFDDIEIKIMDIQDLIINKENLNRPGEKSFLDKYDLEVLKKIVKSKNHK